jgi:hypothetical protein
MEEVDPGVEEPFARWPVGAVDGVEVVDIGEENGRGVGTGDPGPPHLLARTGEMSAASLDQVRRPIGSAPIGAGDRQHHTENNRLGTDQSTSRTDSSDDASQS